MVQFNTDRLEGALGGMAAGSSYLGRNGRFYDLTKLACGSDGLFLSGPYNVLCNILGETVLSVVSDNAKRSISLYPFIMSAAVS